MIHLQSREVVFVRGCEKFVNGPELFCPVQCRISQSVNIFSEISGRNRSRTRRISKIPWELMHCVVQSSRYSQSLYFTRGLQCNAKVSRICYLGSSNFEARVRTSLLIWSGIMLPSFHSIPPSGQRHSATNAWELFGRRRCGSCSNERRTAICKYGQRQRCIDRIWEKLKISTWNGRIWTC